MIKQVYEQAHAPVDRRIRPLCLGGTNERSHPGPDVLSMAVRYTYPVHLPDEVGSALWMCEGVDGESERTEV